VCRGWEQREGEKTTDRQGKRRTGRWETRVEETNQMDVAVKMKMWGGEKRKDTARDGGEGREDSQRRPERAALLVPPK